MRALPPAAPDASADSSRGTMSMRKSNWSDLLIAFAMSARESVRRLSASAMMNARAVISAMNTAHSHYLCSAVSERRTHSRRLCRRELALGVRERRDSSQYMRHTVRRDHLLQVRSSERNPPTKRTLTSGSLFITFLMRASGSGGWRTSGVSCSAVSTWRCQNAGRNVSRVSPDCTYGACCNEDISAPRTSRNWRDGEKLESRE